MSESTDAIATELLSLRGADGKISAPEAVKWARRNRKSALHSRLEWDNDVAGEAYRVWQIRQMISIHILDPDGGRRFVSLSIDRGEGGYRALEDIVARQDLREIMVADALAELDRVQRKYAKLQELQAVWDAAGQVRQRRQRPGAT